MRSQSDEDVENKHESVFVFPTCISLRHIITFSSLAGFVLDNESFVLPDAATCSFSLRFPLTHIKVGKNSRDSKPIIFADDALTQIQLLWIRRIN